MGLVTTSKGSTTQLVSIKDSSVINKLFTKQDGAIEGGDSNGNEVNEGGVVKTNSIKTSKSVKSIDLIQPKKIRVGFFTPKAGLVFTQLRQVFIKAPIL